MTAFIMLHAFLAGVKTVAAAVAAISRAPPVPKKRRARIPKSLSAAEQAFEMLVEGSPLKTALAAAAAATTASVSGRTKRRRVKGLADDMVEKLSEASYK